MNYRSSNCKTGFQNGYFYTVSIKLDWIVFGTSTVLNLPNEPVFESGELPFTVKNEHCSAIIHTDDNHNFFLYLLLVSNEILFVGNRQEVNINWMLTCPDPTPIAFFRYIFPARRIKAIDNYRIAPDLALNTTFNQKVRDKLKIMKEIVDVTDTEDA
ncbi:3859_t:CDS:2 [Ambispora leptoticha]|uniref:3859_t:CDS:1 n=1 Tax=Ambispora leptoticha TaxID=144679 RepID=A0A9N9G446_9GLOM|nr:3859_t:CDS:2 [Ambispora leptoticha]